MKQIKVGVFIDSLYSGYHQFLWRYLQFEARSHNISIQCFCVGVIGISVEHMNSRNLVLNIAAEAGLDVGLVFTHLVGSNIGEGDTLGYIKKKLSIPLISIGSSHKGYPSVVLDNLAGMSEIISHCIEVHNFKRFLIVRGPEFNNEACERYNIAIETLQSYKVNMEDNVDSVVWHYYDNQISLDSIISVLEEKNDIDVIISFDDETAISISNEMKERGVKAPGLIGFDNIPVYLKVFPGLTTVNQPVDILVKKSVNLAISIFENEQITTETKIPTRLVVRTSCGCRYWRDAVQEDSLLTIEFLKDTLTKLSEKHFDSDNSLYWNELMYQILSRTMYQDIMSGTDNEFTVPVFQSLLMETASDISVGELWENLIDELEHEISGKLSSEDTKIRMRSLFYKWREKLSNFYENIKLQLDEQNSDMNVNRRFISDGFLSAHSYPELAQNLSARLPTLNTPAFALYLTESSSRFDSFSIYHNQLENKRYIIKRNPGSAINVYKDFLSKIQGSGIVLVMSLFHLDIFQGYIMFKAENRDSSLYEIVCSQTSNVLNSINQFKKIRIYSDNLEDQVRQRTTILNKAMVELEKANEQLKSIDIIKNDFIMNITHDFRSPLTVINNIAELSLLYTPDLDDETKENFELIYTSGIQLKKYIDQLLELSRIDAKGVKLNISNIQLNSFMDKLAVFYRSSVISSNIIIEADIPGSKIMIYSDLGKLEDVLHNIVSNAVKFVSNQTGIIKIKLSEDVTGVKVSIIDNGIGIDPVNLDIIFKRFEKISDASVIKHRSTGIGLAYATQLVSAMSGKIWAESEGLGKGASFHIELPKGTAHLIQEEIEYHQENITINDEIENILKFDIIRKDYAAQDQRVVIIKKINEENEFDYKRALILIVEDDINIRKIVYEYLINDGFQNFLLAGNGKEALDLYLEHKPDIIVTDLNMPIMMGDELHDEILKTPDGHKIPFIFLSAIADQEISLTQRAKGAIEYLKKPIDKDELLTAVNQHVKRYFDFLEGFHLSI